MSTNADKMRGAFEEFLAEQHLDDLDRVQWLLAHDAFQAGAQWAAPDPQHWQTVIDAARFYSHQALNSACYNSDEATSLRAALRYFEERGMQ